MIIEMRMFACIQIKPKPLLLHVAYVSVAGDRSIYIKRFSFINGPDTRAENCVMVVGDCKLHIGK